MEELCWYGAQKLAKAVRDKEVSPVEVLKVHLERIERENPKVNAIVTLVAGEALEQAQKAEKDILSGAEAGPLCGVPVLIKDNVHTRGIRTTYGSKLYENFVPDEDAVLVKRLKDAGAIVIGKTNIPEFGLVCVTDNLLFGPTRNPWDLSRTPGGSSGGSAAAVALGLAPLATGNDAGGSIRIPAALCGVFGFKPSFGRVPSYPTMPGINSLIHEGPISRSVADAALMMEVVAGPDDKDRFTLPAAPVNYLRDLNNGIEGKKIAYSADLGYAVVDREVAEITLSAAMRFRDLGCQVDIVDITLPDMVNALSAMTVTGVITAQEKRLEEWKDTIYPAFRPMIDRLDTISNRDLARADFLREELWQALQSLFKDYDFLITPTSCVTAFPSGAGGPLAPAEINGRKVRAMSWMAFTYPFNFTGHPAASVPCGFSAEGLPVGLQVVGRRFDDLSVLQASAAFETIMPWANRKPVLP